MKHMRPSPPYTEERHARRGRAGWRVSWHQWDRHQETCRRWWLKRDFHITTKNERGSLRVKQQHLRSALRCYLLEPEGEPAIVPEREYKKREEMRVYLCICLKTWLCLIHPTQVAERSQQLLCKTRVTPLLLQPKPLLRAHHICTCGEHYRMGTQGLKLFSSNFIYTYLFILSLAFIIHSERDQMCLCMCACCKHFNF